MRMRTTVRVNTPRILASLRENVERVIEDTAQAIHDEAQATAPVDTSAMAQSIYVVTKDKSGYEEAVAAAASANPKAEMLPSVEVTEEFTAAIPVAAAYAEYVHDGLGSHIATGPRPFLLNATTAHETQFERDMQRAVSQSSR